MSTIFVAVLTLFTAILFQFYSLVLIYISRSALKNFKYWWDEELSLLKEASIEANKIWKAAGKPRRGPIFSDRQLHRLRYRKRIKEHQKLENEIYTRKEKWHPFLALLALEI